MIIPGHVLIPKTIISNVCHAATQAQPCGVDLTLRRILTWTTAGTIDLTNRRRAKASTRLMPNCNSLPLLPSLPPPSPPLPPLPPPASSSSSSSSSSAFSSASPSASPSSSATASDGDEDEDHIHLSPGAYLVEFNETVDVPLDRMGEIFVRSSLWRAGVALHAGVMDSGYRGAVGALMHVLNPSGVCVYRNARLAQMVFHRMTEEVVGYCGTYQGQRGV
ncbi:MAG: hypothetical protein M1816_002061 [Peltula sp. TS41687]|nr:MAG: hypothetical protein M1816_002061 [Peltula sp. TS41687]